MGKTNLLIILFLYISIRIYSQEWSVNYSTGFGTYKLNDIRDFQQSIVGRYGLKITDSFHGYITHTTSLAYTEGKNQFGCLFSYLTTGGRLHRADYSGSYSVDMILNGYRYGVFYRKYFKAGPNPDNLYIQLTTGVLSTDFRTEERINIYDETALNSTLLDGTCLYIEPSVGQIFRITKQFNLTLGIGYEIDLPEKLKFESQKTNISADWSGFRFYGGIIYIINTK
ncbi:MAG: hypothetical protein ACOYOT_08150 [Bacteroidales bacterium]